MCVGSSSEEAVGALDGLFVNCCVVGVAVVGVNVFGNAVGVAVVGLNVMGDTVGLAVVGRVGAGVGANVHVSNGNDP